MIDFEHFQKLVRLRLEELLLSVQQGSTSADTVELDQTRVGRLSRMDALQMQQMGLALSRRRQQELIALQHALKRIENGEYGECFECGEEINPKRLEIDLAATLCISCAAQKET